MTVEELLQLPTIKGLKLISGNLGVHREISTVTVVDTPDGFQWLKGNEVVITTTYALEKTPNSFLDFISKLLSRNISALIVKSDRYIKVIPENAKKLCDEKVLWSSIFVTLMANKIGGLQFGIYRNCQISSRVFHTAVAALPLTKANRSDFE